MPIKSVLDNARSLGEAIRTVREARRMTLRELAARTHLSAPFLSDIEHNRRSTDQLDAIAKALEVPVEALKKLDGRLSQELKDWMTANPALSGLLESYRKSGKSVDQLLQVLQSSAGAKDSGR